MASSFLVAMFLSLF